MNGNLAGETNEIVVAMADDIAKSSPSEGPDPTVSLGDIGARDDDDAIARRICEWADRLLQLDRRNNLLYFKPGRSAVGITSITPDELDERLRRSRLGLEFPYSPPAPTRRRGFAVQDDTNHTDDVVVYPGDMTTDCEPADLQRRLRNLQRRDREWEEEQGLNVLFLTMGFLNWVDADGEQARSPLLLIPCDLERNSPRDRSASSRRCMTIVNHTVAKTWLLGSSPGVRKRTRGEPMATTLGQGRCSHPQSQRLVRRFRHRFGHLFLLEARYVRGLDTDV